MKRIEAIIRKTKFEEVKEALLSSDIDWFEYHNVHAESSGANLSWCTVLNRRD